MPTIAGQVSNVDLRLLRPGERLTVVVDGWLAESLTLGLTDISLPLTAQCDQAIVYGIDHFARLRHVLVRSMIDLPALGFLARAPGSNVDGGPHRRRPPRRFEGR